MFQLTSLLARTIEAISFVLLLSDHKLGELVKKYVLLVSFVERYFNTFA